MQRVRRGKREERRKKKRKRKKERGKREKEGGGREKSNASEAGALVSLLRHCDSVEGKFYFAAPLRNSLHKTVGDIRAGAATWNEAIHIKNTQQRQN